MRNSLEDILIVCCDGLGEEITATWPEATVQTCMVHLCRAQGLVVSQTG
jgi:transposase-like protein